MNELLLRAVGCEIWKEELKVFTQSREGKIKKEKGSLVFSLSNTELVFQVCFGKALSNLLLKDYKEN